ncbi:hypothetical protein OIU77_004618 [Salix suchowensis]|uniref:Cytochrome P450 n=1 Tax=Salix suchowensis TaxID=1278906 RepID=A0ABQ9AXW3_9ROSI|nr:hypothetical protein OIU77_004618 [Salix suchowensis]
MLLASDENGQPLNERDIAYKVLGLLVAGHDTTSSAITMVIYYLAEYPHIYQRVLEEQKEIAMSKAPGELLNWEDVQKMNYSWSVACEVLRVSPPVSGTFREVIADISFAGFSIPKGWKAYWSVYSTHKNPKYFPDPERKRICSVGDSCISAQSGEQIQMGESDYKRKDHVHLICHASKRPSSSSPASRELNSLRPVCRISK